MSARRYIIIFAFVAMGAVASVGRSANQSSSALEQERVNDERMWQLIRLMLVEFGYSNKVAALDQAWKRTKTPQEWAQVDWSRLQPPPFPPAARRVATRCAALGHEDFSTVFQAACREAADVRSLVTGLLAWTQNGGRPVIQGRHDLALHFIYAAVGELTEMGKVLSFVKEQIDESSGKPFDLDDLAAGFTGAEWVRQARKNSQWLQLWGTGEKNVRAHFPQFRFGVNACSAHTLRQIQQEIERAFAATR